MHDEKRQEPLDVDDGPVELDGPVETMSMKNSFGTAIGAAMLGFEQALRKEPPAEILAAEHMPERDQATGNDGDLVIDFPDPIVRSADE